MKKLFAVLAALALMVAFSACSRAEDENKQTAVDSNLTAALESETDEATTDDSAEHNSEPVTATNNVVSAIAPPEGWVLDEEYMEDTLQYVMVTDMYETDPQSCPRMMIGWADVSAEDFLESVREVSDGEGITYSETTQKLGDYEYHMFIPSEGKNLLLREADGHLAVIYYSKNLSLNDAGTRAILNSIHIADDLLR